MKIIYELIPGSAWMKPTWFAVDEDTYDGAEDGNRIHGQGETKEEARAELICELYTNAMYELTDIEVENIDTYDHPDYVDAYLSYAEMDGEKLTDSDLELLHETFPEIAQEYAFKITIGEY